MTDRERLIDLIKKSENQAIFDALTADLDDLIDISVGTQFNGTVEYLADYLISNGVVVMQRETQCNNTKQGESQ